MLLDVVGEVAELNRLGGYVLTPLGACLGVRLVRLAEVGDVEVVGIPFIGTSLYEARMTSHGPGAEVGGPHGALHHDADGVRCDAVGRRENAEDAEHPRDQLGFGPVGDETIDDIH